MTDKPNLELLTCGILGFELLVVDSVIKSIESGNTTSLKEVREYLAEYMKEMGAKGATKLTEFKHDSTS